MTKTKKAFWRKNPLQKLTGNRKPGKHLVDGKAKERKKRVEEAKKRAAQAARESGRAAMSAGKDAGSAAIKGGREEFRAMDLEVVHPNGTVVRKRGAPVPPPE